MKHLREIVFVGVIAALTTLIGGSTTLASARNAMTATSLALAPETEPMGQLNYQRKLLLDNQPFS